MSQKTAIEIASQLNSNMPNIGFCSKDKRIRAYAFITSMAEELADRNTELALESLVILTHMNKPFHKASGMVALNITRLPVALLDEAGYIMANELAKRQGLAYME